MMRPPLSVLATAVALVLAGCGDSTGPGPATAGAGTAASSAAPAAGGPAFVNVAEAANLRFKVGATRPYMDREPRAVAEATFGGVAAGDCDADGDIDLFITYGNTGGPDGGGGANRLYLNQVAERGSGLYFEDVAEAAGVANTRADGRGNDRHSGPTFADMDGDGDLDLFLGGIYGDPNRIYANHGNCQFTDVTAGSPDIANMIAPHTISAAFGDYDLDGDLDMFVTHWATRDTLYVISAEGNLRESEHLFRNDSDATGIRFVNVSGDSGVSSITWGTRRQTFHDIPQDADFTFTPTFARINDDVWPDIALASDFGTTQLAINSGQGTFIRLDDPILREAQYGMGSALGDFDNDGDLDWFLSSISGPGDGEIQPHGNRLFVNDQVNYRLVDDTVRLGVEDGSWGWGACFADLNNDTRLDLYHTNGWSEPYLGHQVWQVAPARAYLLSAAGTFEDRAAELGLGTPASGRGVVCADFDHDGDTDILEIVRDAENSARLWENRQAAAGQRFIRVKLEGLPPNTEAAGARIFLTTGQTRQMREIMIGSNFTSQNPTVQVFGLGAAEAADELLIEWPALNTAEGPAQIGTLLEGPIAAGTEGQTLILSHPGLQAP